MTMKIFPPLLAIICLALLAIICLALLAGCGGGGGGGSSSGPTVTTTLKTAGLLATGQTIAGLDVTLEFPVGVTVKTDPSTGKVESSVVQISGVANPSEATIGATYTPATANSRGKLHLIVASARGFGVGEFITIRCNITPGATITATDFTLGSFFEASDLNGNIISSLTATMDAQLI
jgi:hypothetical protein